MAKVTQIGTSPMTKSDQEMTMRMNAIQILVAAALTAGSSGAALAFGGGGGDSGSGLSPYAALSGNDRSAGVNNGNYRDPRLDPYIQTYDLPAGYAHPRRSHHHLIMRPYHG